MKTVRDCLAEIDSRYPEAQLFTGDEQYDKDRAFAVLYHRMGEEASIEGWDKAFIKDYGVTGNFSIRGRVEYNVIPPLELLRIDVD
jgi:hypothetical protein